MKTGSANGKTPKKDDALMGTQRTSAPAHSTSGTSATDMARIATRSVTLASSISAKLTPPSSSESTVWTLSPIGYIDSGCPKITDAELLLLEPEQLRKLRFLMEGRGETAEQVLAQIIDFYVDMGSPWLDKPLDEMLKFYLDNNVI